MHDYRPFFATILKAKYPNTFDVIYQRIEQHYMEISIDTIFAKTSKNPVDRRLDFCSYFLALIKTLDERSETFENIRAICLEITIAYVQPRSQVHAWFKKVIPKLTLTWLGKTLIKTFHRRISVNDNKDGFIANIITDKSETFGLGYGIDIIECGICKLFKKHDYSKYATILCEVDEITSALAGLELIRTGTIANGASKCDFRFKRV